MKVFTFDVFTATHDQVMAGQVRAVRHRVVVSAVEFPTYAAAYDAAACLAACVHGGMPTEVMPRH
jgi:hypothetical protein